MARHLSSLKVKTFRGIKDLEVMDLGDINILVGANNCGKTSLLEAIMLFSRPDDLTNVVSIARLREVNRNLPFLSASFFDSFLYLFNRLNDELLMSVSASINNIDIMFEIKGRIEKVLMDINEEMKNNPLISRRAREGSISEGEEVDSFIGEIKVNNIGQLSFEPNHIPISFHKYERVMRMNQKTPFLNMTFVSTIDHIVKNTFRGVIRNRKLKNIVVEILKLFDSNITDLRIIQDEDRRVSQVIDNSLLDYMPLSTYGDGIKKVIALANGIAEAQNGVLLVDEIETSIHASVLKKVFLWLINACKEFNVQLFLTTHSLETVDKLLDSASSFENSDLIRVITLVRKDHQTVARVLAGKKAQQVREDYDMELR
ncbi:MAG: AAA family ATPase [Desulfitobacteriaceae bacterium]